MEMAYCEPENQQIIEVEIYETGEKTRLAANKQLSDKKYRPGRSIIITAAEYESYKTDIMNIDM